MSANLDLESEAEAAEAASDFARALRAWEGCMNFGRAARAALALGDSPRAAVLAARSRDSEEIARVLDAPGGDAGRVADALERAGFTAIAAQAFERALDMASAARTFEQAGLPKDAARCALRGGDMRAAARCLELAGDHVELGRLLLAHGRALAAARHLQRVRETGAGLALLRNAMEALGFDEAVRDIEREMMERGVPREGAASAESAETVLFGRYGVVREIASTATARVYEAVDRVTQGRVAVKVYAPTVVSDAGRDALLRFEREARAVGALEGAPVVPLRAFEPAGPAIVTEFMTGGSLADRAPLSPAHAAEVARAVLSALEEAHRRGMLHRDVKPENVLFDGAGAPRLADFGTAHLADAAATVTSGVLGTLAYMPPELRAGGKASPRSDVYGAGAVLWFALTGAPPGASELPPALGQREQVIARTLVAGDRPASARDALELVRSGTWPACEPVQRPRVEATPEHARAPTSLGRRLILADERARAFARADHPALALVIGPTDGGVLVEDPDGERPRTLLEGERSRLAEALGKLHELGSVHGSVSTHVVRRGGEILLAFPTTQTEASASDDLAALEAMS